MGEGVCASTHRERPFSGSPGEEDNGEDSRLDELLPQWRALGKTGIMLDEYQIEMDLLGPLVVEKIRLGPQSKQRGGGERRG